MADVKCECCNKDVPEETTVECPECHKTVCAAQMVEYQGRPMCCCCHWTLYEPPAP
jgi:hypothetical protein